MAVAIVEQEDEIKLSSVTPEQFVKSSQDNADQLIGIMKELEKFRKKYSVMQSSLPSHNNYIAFKKKMSNGMLLLPVIGQGSSGKSTLINSILGDIFLPFSVGRDTKVRVLIRHDPTCHAHRCNASCCSKCSKCPKLYVGLQATEGNEEARGVNAIHEAIQAYNTKLKVTSKCLLLLANIPCIAASNTELPLTPYLLDSEALQYLSDDTKDEMEVIVGTILVHKYTEFLQDEDSIHMSLAVAKSATVLVAITWFDEFYDTRKCSSEGRNPTKDQTKEEFAEFSSVTKAENVFPLCSKWALDGRIMKHLGNKEEADNMLTEDILHGLSRYNGKRIPFWKPEMTNEIIKASGIEEIEERIQRLFAEFDHSSWCQMILDELTKFVEKSIMCAESILAILNEAISRDTDRINKRERGRSALFACRDSLKGKSENAYMPTYRMRVKKVLKIPTHDKIQSLATSSVKTFISTWDEKTDGTVYQFLSEMEELILRRIPAEIVDHIDVLPAEIELETTDKEFFEEYNKFCGYLEDFVADGRRIKRVEAMPGISSTKFKNEAKSLSPEAAQHQELLSSFRMAVEEQKHGLLALIGTAVSMISLVSIPWAIRKFKEHFKQNQIGASIARAVGKGDSFIKTFTTEDIEYLQDRKVSEYPGLKMMKEKLKEISTSSDYIQSLADDVTTVAKVCVFEPFAEAARKGAERVFQRLTAEIRAADMHRLHEGFEREKKSVASILDDKVKIQHLIDKLKKLKECAKRECPKKISVDGSM